MKNVPQATSVDLIADAAPKGIFAKMDIMLDSRLSTDRKEYNYNITATVLAKRFVIPDYHLWRKNQGRTPPKLNMTIHDKMNDSASLVGLLSSYHNSFSNGL